MPWEPTKQTASEQGLQRLLGSPAVGGSTGSSRACRLPELSLSVPAGLPVLWATQGAWNHLEKVEMKCHFDCFKMEIGIPVLCEISKIHVLYRFWSNFVVVKFWNFPWNRSSSSLPALFTTNNLASCILTSVEALNVLTTNANEYRILRDSFKLIKA